MQLLLTDSLNLRPFDSSVVGLAFRAAERATTMAALCPFRISFSAVFRFSPAQFGRLTFSLLEDISGRHGAALLGRHSQPASCPHVNNFDVGRPS